MVDAYGRRKMDGEKEKMRNVLSREINQCKSSITEITRPTRNFCDDYKKGSALMINKVRHVQRQKSLEILQNLQLNSTNKR